MKKLKFALIGFFLLMFLVQNINAEEIEFLPHEQDTDFKYSFTDDLAGNCNITTMNTPNNTVIWINQEMTKTGNTFNATILSGNFSELGIYCFNFICEDGYGDLCREVTPNGELASSSKTALSIVLLIILVIFFIMALIGFFKTEDPKGKLALYWVCHVLIIGITFIAWTTAVNYLSMDGGVAGIFKILFFFFTIAVVPMIILSMAWIFYIHTFNEHFQKLIDKGEDTETAFAMTKKKKGGWFHGK